MPEGNNFDLRSGAISPVPDMVGAWTFDLRSGRLVVEPSSVTTQTITCTGIPSSETWGAHRVNLTIACSGIASAEAWGSHRVNLTINVTGIASREAWGTPKITEGVAVGGIPSAEAWGTPTVTASAVIVCTGIPSAEAWGNCTVTTGVQPTPPTPTTTPGGPVIVVRRRSERPEPRRRPRLQPVYLRARSASATRTAGRYYPILATSAVVEAAAITSARSRPAIALSPSPVVAAASMAAHGAWSDATLRARLITSAHLRVVVPMSAYTITSVEDRATPEAEEGDLLLMGDGVLV